MISIFPSWTFHLYVATKQQHLHMEYMYIKKAATLKVSDSTKISNMTGAIKEAGTAYPPGHMSSLLFYTTSTIFQNGINPPKTSFYFKNTCLKMLWSKNFTNLQLTWNSVSIFSQHYLPKTWSFRLCFFLITTDLRIRWFGATLYQGLKCWIYLLFILGLMVYCAS